LPNPLDWLPIDRVGANRFDDPARQFRVLYAARQRTACFAETLALFRPSLELLAETGDPVDITGDVSAGFLPSHFGVPSGLDCTSSGSPTLTWAAYADPSAFHTSRGRLGS
jgi:hypothetical protein